MPLTETDPSVADNPPPVADSPTPLATLDTGYLRRAKAELMNLIPGDPTAISHVLTILRAIVTAELSDPARLARDEADAKAALELADRLAAEAEAAKAPQATAPAAA